FLIRICYANKYPAQYYNRQKDSKDIFSYREIPWFFICHYMMTFFIGTHIQIRTMVHFIRSIVYLIVITCELLTTFINYYRAFVIQLKLFCRESYQTIISPENNR